MTNQQHPITPTHEQIKKWQDKFFETEPFLQLYDDKNFVVLLNQVYQAGADQELEACCEWTQYCEECGDSLRAVRRPKPPSLREQALEALQFVDEKLDLPLHNHCNAIHTIRRALQELPE